MIAHDYPGEGTAEVPYRVTFVSDDPHDPLQWSFRFRWMLCCIAGFATFSVAFISSSYASGIPQIVQDLGGSEDVATLGLSLFLVGFTLGPFVWAPASERYGRRPIFILSTGGHVAFNIAICFAPSVTWILLLRLCSGTFGAAPLTNAGAVIADIFPPKQRGLAITVYALVPLFAPAMGPLIGGFVAEATGWRGIMRLNAILSACAWILLLIALPETYTPALLRLRAQRLTQLTGKVYVFVADKADITTTRFCLPPVMFRPFQLAVQEPIILLVALYQALVFGTLYLTFAAFPILYGPARGWSPGMSGLSFIGLVIGILCSVVFQLWDNQQYVRLLKHLYPEPAPPEARLPGCCIGSVSLAVGLFWFAWTSSPDIHWAWSIAAGVPFGFGVVLITIGSTNYLVDSYTAFAASALTVCICARAVCGALAPLLVRSAFNKVGVQWALMIPAGLVLLCAPFPFALYCYGGWIRSRFKSGKLSDAINPRLGHFSTETTRLLEEN